GARALRPELRRAGDAHAAARPPARAPARTPPGRQRVDRVLGRGRGRRAMGRGHRSLARPARPVAGPAARGRPSDLDPVQPRRRPRRRAQAAAARRAARGLAARPHHRRDRLRGGDRAGFAVRLAVPLGAAGLHACARGRARGRVRGGVPMTSRNSGPAPAASPAPATPRRFWPALASLVVLALLSSVHSLVFAPLAARYRQLLDDAGEMGAPLDARLALAPLPPRVTQLVRANSVTAPEAEQQSQSGFLATDLVRRIARSAVARGMDVAASEPGAVAQTPGTVEVRAELRLRGRYAQLVLLLDDLSREHSL